MKNYTLHIGTNDNYKQIVIMGLNAAINKYNEIALNHSSKPLMLTTSEDKIIKQRNCNN